MPGTGLTSNEQVLAALKAVDFPATKEELLAEAKAASADRSVLAALSSLPVDEYANRDEVLRSIDTVEGTGSSPSQHARQARSPGRPGLAQHQRGS